MKKFLSKVLLTVLCVVSSLALFASCDEEVENPVSEYDFSFTGEITLNEIYYEVVMEGKDNAFTVDAGNISSVTKGNYTFTEGKGYTFTFNDSAGTIVRTQYDASSQTFSFIYTLDLGTARGSGNLLLSYTDTSFVHEGELWADIPSFSGTAAWFGGVLTGTVNIVCDADNGFTTVSPDTEGLDVVEGTYSYENGCYVFTATDGEVYTSFLNAEGLHEVTIPIIRPALVSYGAERADTTFIQVVKTVD